MVKSRSTGRKLKRGPQAAKAKENRFVSEESTPERRKLNKQSMDEYLKTILSKRQDRGSSLKPFQTWKNPEVVPCYADRRCLQKTQTLDSSRRKFDQNHEQVQQGHSS